MIGFWIVVGGIIALALGPPLFGALTRALTNPPSITNLHTITPVLSKSVIEIGFDYQPSNTQGDIKVQFFTAGEIIDSQTLDTKEMTPGSQTVSTTAFLDTSYADGTVTLYWCPNYNCTNQQEMGTTDFSLPTDDSTFQVACRLEMEQSTG
ncbi:hypothetical protein KSF_075950 [Reticulibacter mediterranei]|uniref:Uncharacterized protein n=1 Tax=Reticulibacter mediterranei TaxID=2778369 RepID=A0A8J3N7U7_9CHLR|nr:hypothetical protein KSF_075950 [Reticulibacter mediterranei]